MGGRTVIRVQGVEVIARPVEDVFDYVVRPDTATSWRKGVIEARQMSDGPMSVGTRVMYVRYLAGRRFEAISRISAYEPGRLYQAEDETGEPFAVSGCISLEPGTQGTQLTYDFRAEPGRFLRLVRPLVGAVFRREVTNDFRKLKGILESQVDATR